MLTGSPSGLATIRTQWDASEVEGQRILSRAGRDSNAGGRLLDVEVLNLERPVVGHVVGGGQAGRELAQRMATHCVGDRPASALGLIDAGILVDLADQASFAQRPVLPREVSSTAVLVELAPELLIATLVV